ncbi:MAG: hypothetical protein ACI8PB_000212 [Desulforhopalus sp.]|jgi:hypothetical protein
MWIVDGEGLFFEITSTGVKRWLYRFKIDGTSGMYVVGQYLALSLKDARAGLEAAKSFVKPGIKFSQTTRAIKQENISKEQKKKDDRTKSFKYVALEWIEQQKGNWSHDHATAVHGTLKIDIFVKIGENAVGSITPPEILMILS